MKVSKRGGKRCKDVGEAYLFTRRSIFIRFFYLFNCLSIILVNTFYFSLRLFINIVLFYFLYFLYFIFLSRLATSDEPLSPEHEK